MKTKEQFYGLGTELTVSYLPDGEIDHAAMARMTEFQAEHGTGYIFVNGVSSECFMMTAEEQEALCKTVCSAAKQNGLSTMANLLVPGWRDAIVRAHQYLEAGADSICISPPYLNSYNDASLEEYFGRIIETLDVPVYIYNMPQTGVLMSPKLVASITNRYPQVIGYKDSTQSVVHLQTLQGLVKRPDYEVIAGSDATIFTTLALGGVGIISFISIAFPEPVKEICDRYFAGDVEGAKKAQDYVMKIRDVLKKGGNSAGYKYASELMGVPIRGTRYPTCLLELPQTVKDEIRNGLSELGLL